MNPTVTGARLELGAILRRYPSRAPSPRVPGWRPQFADYRIGLDQVVAAWQD